MQVGSVYIKKLNAPVYRTSLWIVVSDSIANSIDTIEDMIDKVIAHPKSKKSIAAYTYGYEDHQGKYRVVIFVKQSAGVGEIAHEANHAKNIIMHWNGVKPSFTNDEWESYYLEYIVNKIHQAIRLSLPSVLEFLDHPAYPNIGVTS